MNYVNPFLYDETIPSVLLIRNQNKSFFRRIVEGDTISFEEPETFKLQRGVEYDYEDFPLQPLGKYEIRMKNDSYGGKYVSGCYYNAYKCIGDVWMVENDNGKFMLFDREDITFF